MGALPDGHLRGQLCAGHGGDAQFPCVALLFLSTLCVLPVRLPPPSFLRGTVYSYLTSAGAAGLFVGSLAVRYLGRRFAKKQLLLTGLGLDGLGMAFVRTLPLALSAKFGSGLGGGLSDSIWPTLIQENVEEDERGRAFSLFVGVVTIPPAITVYLGGWLADRTSLQLVYGLAGGWVLITAIGSRFLGGYRAIAETDSGGG